jgi:HKD family nuclease
MNINLLGQGFEATSHNSVGNQLIKFLADKSFHTFTGISAFASQAGINGLAKYIATAKKHLNIITIVTGVDQKGTSKEALEALLKLGVNAYVFYQPSITIFHPKIYLFEGDEKTELIIGSSNLTAQGLFTNVEASLLVSIDNSVEADRKIVEQLKDYFKGVFDFSDPNLKKLSKKIITDLVKAKVVPTEAERKAIQDKGEKGERKETENIIAKIFPKRAIAKIPKEFRGKRTVPQKVIIVPVEATEEKPTAFGKLVWRKLALSQSDAQNVPSGTAITANLKLSQAKFQIGGQLIDQTIYFRNTVFRNLKWIKTKPESNTYEEAICKFNLHILGKFVGVHELKLSHDKVRVAGQGNTPTWLHWGDTLTLIRKTNLTGKRLDLYAPKGKSKVFHIAIE